MKLYKVSMTGFCEPVIAEDTHRMDVIVLEESSDKATSVAQELFIEYMTERMIDIDGISGNASEMKLPRIIKGSIHIAGNDA